MKRAIVLIPIMTLFALTGCNRAQSADAGSEDGHYSGVGIYEADGVWKHVRGAPATKGELAKLKDDSKIIVVVDRTSGEIRQCGNHSGFCVAMNPWKGAALSLPAALDAHADEIDTAANAVENAVELAAVQDKGQNRKK